MHRKETWQIQMVLGTLVPVGPALFEARPVLPKSNSLPAHLVKSPSTIKGPGFDPQVGRTPWRRKGYPLQYSGPVFMDCIVHGVAKSRMRLSDYHFTSVLPIFSTNQHPFVKFVCAFFFFSQSQHLLLRTKITLTNTQEPMIQNWICFGDDLSSLFRSNRHT